MATPVLLALYYAVCTKYYYGRPRTGTIRSCGPGLGQPGQLSWFPMWLCGLCRDPPVFISHPLPKPCGGSPRTPPKKKKKTLKNGCPIGGAKSPCNRLPCAEGFWNMTSSPELSHCQDWRPFHAADQRLSRSKMQRCNSAQRHCCWLAGSQMHCVHYVHFACISTCVNRQSVSHPTWRINSAMRRLPNARVASTNGSRAAVVHTGGLKPALDQTRRMTQPWPGCSKSTESITHSITTVSVWEGTLHRIYATNHDCQP